MDKTIIKTNKGNYAAIYSKGTKYNDICIVYYHGLGGKSKVNKPLFSKVCEYDFYSIEERGHIDSLQKASIMPSKHDKDVFNVVSSLRNKYKKIYLCGESMGALFISRYAYKWNDVDAVFAWSIPFQPKDIMKENKKKKFIIFFRVFMCFLFGWNYKYKAVVDYPKLTNSKFLMKLNNMDVETMNSTSEEIAIWKASLGIKRKFLYKKSKCPIYYWQGENDIMSNKKLLKKMQSKNFINAYEIKNAKHILMFEEGFDQITNKMLEIIKTNH